MNKVKRQKISNRDEQALARLKAVLISNGDKLENLSYFIECMVNAIRQLQGKNRLKNVLKKDPNKVLSSGANATQNEYQ